MNRKKPIIGFFSLHFDPPIGGAERSMANVFYKLKDHLDIRVFCFLEQNGKKFNQTISEYKDGIRITRTALSLERVVEDFIHNENPDYIGTMLIGSNLVINIAARRKIPVLFFAHGLFEDICQHYLRDTCEYNDLKTCNNYGCINTVVNNMKKIQYSYCKKIYCNSEYTSSIFFKFFPNISEKISVLYPDFNCDLFYSDKTNRDKKMVLAVNSMITKGRNIVRALAIRNPDLKFIYVDCKQDDIEYLSEASNIKTIGYVPPEELSLLYKKSGAYICPTYMQETFGCTVAEAILSGTPVVAMGRGNINNLIKDGKNGFLMNTLSIDEWDSKLQKAINMTPDDKIRRDFYSKLKMNTSEVIINDICGEIKFTKEEKIEEKEDVIVISREHRRKSIKKYGFV